MLEFHLKSLTWLFVRPDVMMEKFSTIGPQKCNHSEALVPILWTSDRIHARSSSAAWNACMSALCVHTQPQSHDTSSSSVSSCVCVIMVTCALTTLRLCAQVDVFSLGVILYGAMVKALPDPDRRWHRPSKPATFRTADWNRVSRPCKALCAK